MNDDRSASHQTTEQNATPHCTAAAAACCNARHFINQLQQLPGIQTRISTLQPMFRHHPACDVAMQSADNNGHRGVHHGGGALQRGQWHTQNFG